MSRTEVQQVASLHEKAVQAVARGEVASSKRGRRNSGKPKSTPVKTVKVDKRVVKTVQSLNAPKKHIQWAGPECAIIWNHPAPWPEVK